MSTVGGKFTTEKRNLVTYIENKDYELLRKLAVRHGRSVSAEAALAVQKHLNEPVKEWEPEISKKPIHPGRVLLEEFLKPMSLSRNRLALNIGVPPYQIYKIVLGKRSITADTALRLAHYFGMSPQFWLGLQMDYDLSVTADALEARLVREIKPITMPDAKASG